jgi:hypothetical protein
LDTEITELESMEGMARSMQADAGNIDKYGIDIRDLSRKIASLQARVSSSGTTFFVF